MDLFLANPVGAKTGRLLPTGRPVDDIAGYAVSCVDVAVPMVIARASDFGRTAHETVEELEADRDLMRRCARCGSRPACAWRSKLPVGG